MRQPGSHFELWSMVAQWYKTKLALKGWLLILDPSTVGATMTRPEMEKLFAQLMSRNSAGTKSVALEICPQLEAFIEARRAQRRKNDTAVAVVDETYTTPPAVPDHLKKQLPIKQIRGAVEQIQSLTNSSNPS